MYHRSMTTQKILKTATAILGIVGLFAAIISAGIIDSGGSTHDLVIWGATAMGALVASLTLQNKIR